MNDTCVGCKDADMNLESYLIHDGNGAYRRVWKQKCRKESTCERFKKAEEFKMENENKDEEEMKDSRQAFNDLMSAQSEPIRINLNEPIKVKLTDWGKEIYYHQHDRINQIAGREICKPMFPREDENGYTEFQLWCFIELYGMHMGMTLPNVIEPLEIVYER